MRVLMPIAAVLASLDVSPALANENLSLGGHVKGFYFQQVTEPYRLDRIGSRLQLAAWGGLGDPVDYYAAVDFELDSRLLWDDQPARRGEGFDVYPVEIYAHLTPTMQERSAERMDAIFKTG